MISNTAIVVLAIANGIALGVQPIASREFGEGHLANVTQALKRGSLITLALAAINFTILMVFKTPIIALFNTDHSAQLAAFANTGVPIYFTGIFFIAMNLMMILFLTAINMPRASFALSLLRGYAILLPAILLMAQFFGINGVWAAVPFTEGVVFVIGITIIIQRLRKWRQ